VNPYIDCHCGDCPAREAWGREIGLRSPRVPMVGFVLGIGCGVVVGFVFVLVVCGLL
jgi:hypothetical protein